MLTPWLAIILFLAGPGCPQKACGGVFVAPSSRVKGDSEVELTLGCGDGTSAGALQHWHTPFGPLKGPWAPGPHEYPVYMHGNGSLVVTGSSLSHSSLYYCLLQNTKETEVWSYQLQLRSGPHRQYRQDVQQEPSVPQERLVGAVVASVLLSFVVGFSAGAVSRTQVLRCLRVLRRNRTPIHQVPDPVVSMSTLSQQSTGPPPKPQRSFKRDEQPQPMAYLESCDHRAGQSKETLTYLREERGVEEESGVKEDVGIERGVKEEVKDEEEEVEDEEEEEVKDEEKEVKDDEDEVKEIKEERGVEEKVGNVKEEVKNVEEEVIDEEEEVKDVEEEVKDEEEEVKDVKEEVKDEEEEVKDEEEEVKDEEEEVKDVEEEVKDEEGEVKDVEERRAIEEESDSSSETGQVRCGGSGQSREGPPGDTEHKDKAGEEAGRGPQVRVIRLYQYNQDGERYGHLPAPSPHDPGPLPSHTLRSRSLSRLKAIMDAASGGPMDTGQGGSEAQPHRDTET